MGGDCGTASADGRDRAGDAGSGVATDAEATTTETGAGDALVLDAAPKCIGSGSGVAGARGLTASPLPDAAGLRRACDRDA